MASWSVALALAIAYTYTRSLGIQDRIDRSVAKLEPIGGNLTSRTVRSAVNINPEVFHPDLSRQDADFLRGALAKQTVEKRLFESSK
jgi:hypothetical protein